jgi:hypothetical protein
MALAALCLPVFGAMGQSTVISLTFPFGARHGQWQISLSAFGLLSGPSDDDLEWWRPKR